MAKKEEQLMNEVATVKVKALINLKYDKDCFAIGDELNVRIEDVQEIVDKCYVELLGEFPKEEYIPKDGE